VSKIAVLTCGPVTLRPPLSSDATDRLRAGYSPEYVRLCGGMPDPAATFGPEQARLWYEQVCREPYGWCIEVQGSCIGHARLHSLDLENRRVRYAIGIFLPAAWGHGYGTITTLLILGYAFEDLRLHRVDLRVLGTNTRAIACYERCGFRKEGIEREGAWIEGTWHSDVMMSILEQEYRPQNDSVGPADAPHCPSQLRT